jgi:hypothetical protein
MVVVVHLMVVVEAMVVEGHLVVVVVEDHLAVAVEEGNF